MIKAKWQCAECKGHGHHRAFCSQNKNHPTPTSKTPPQKNKQNWRGKKGGDKYEG